MLSNQGVLKTMNPIGGASAKESVGHSAALNQFLFVYFGNDWRAENRTSSHHIADRLMQNGNVLYVDSPGLRSPKTSSRDFKKLIAKVKQFVSRPVQIKDHAWRCTVPQIPFRRLPLIPLVNQWVSRWAVRRAIRLAGFAGKKVILWFAVPHPGFLVGRLGESYVVYYCIDDYAAHPGVDPVQVEKMDRALAGAADRVFVAPPALLESKKVQNASALYSPHGVDVDLFGLAASPKTQLPGALKNITNPVIGYFGSLAQWIDIELLAHVARKNPDFTMILVGHVDTNVEVLRNLENVWLVGPQPYKELPSWAKSFSVAIIPYLRNQQVMNANPLKLREYLATGKPIVAVSNPEIDKFAEVINIAHSHDEFAALVRQAALSDTPELSRARMAIVKNMTWDSRVREVLEVVVADLALKK
jgi:glycosyltransferase involved in cell wall biosynthesis